VRRLPLAVAVVAAALVLPASAWAHAVLLRTVPAASALVNTAPRQLALVYSEAVEPRFAIVSVTNAAGDRQTAGPPHRSPADPNELDVPLKQLGEGWYLVFWRAISEDGHPVRGAFTFAVGPNPGPAPQFVIPSLSETAATPGLVIARWIVFLSFMVAIGVFVLRMTVARPLERPPHALIAAFAVALGVALVAVPFYVLYSTSRFALRSLFALDALIPLMRNSAFGRGYLELEIMLALFGVAAVVCFVVDRPASGQRSVAELLALLGALLAAGAVLLAPGAAGHAAQTSPRPLALTLDWLHLASGSLWIGGLVGLLVLWRSLPKLERLAGLALCVPRFSNVALASVALLLGSGIWASVLHLPTFASLWQTSYGQAILVKAGLLGAALVAGATNLLRTTPALRSPEPSPGAAVLLRSLVGGETVLLAGAVAAAAVLSSLPPPPKAIAGLKPSAHVGPGVVARTVTQNGYTAAVRVTPNRAAVPNTFSVRLSRGGKPVRGADVTARFTMLDMEMPSQEVQLSEQSPGVYTRAAPTLVMVGRWGISFDIAPQHAAPLSVVLLDKAGG
jgi:copper transport protein